MNANREYYFKELTSSDDIYNGNINSKIKLKQHQLTLLNKCVELENEGININDNKELTNKYNNVKSNIGILADKVGSGKSYTILALLLINQVPKINYKRTYVYANGHISFTLNDIKYKKEWDLNILVISHSLINQWTSYINDFSDDIKYYLVNTSKSLEKLNKYLENINLLIVTANFYKKIIDIFDDDIVNRVIFDEVDTVKTPGAKKIPAKFYWFISASYKNILYPYPSFYHDMYRNSQKKISSGINNNIFAKRIFVQLLENIRDVDIKCIDRIVIKNNDDYVNKSFELPDPIIKILECKSSYQLNVLNGISNKYIIDSLNAGDEKTALSYINQKNINNEKNIINCIQEEFINKLKNIEMTITLTKNLIFNSEEERQNKLIKLGEEENNLKEKVELLKKRINDNNLCGICFEPFTKKTITKCCKNTYCFECINKWLVVKPICLLCKKPCDVINDLYVVDEDYIPIKDKLDKYEMLEKIIKDRETNSKILIFSEYENTFNKIKNLLNKENIKYGLLKGNGVKDIVNKYRNENIDVLLVNSSNYGSGLNLENTTDIILFHKFDNQLEQQVIGRAQRPGRNKALKVWYLLHKNELNNH